MGRSIRGPTDEHPYLREANYYRLAYQLAAQELNRALERTQDALASAGTSEHVAPALDNGDGLDPAEHLAVDARQMIAWFDQRDENSRWWRRDPRKLERTEERLRRFLVKTIEPCAELVVAGALVHRGRPADAERRVTALLEKRSREELSYRSTYNLACYEVTVGSVKSRKGSQSADAASKRQPKRPQDKWFNLALEDLRRAFRSKHGHFRAALVSWAEMDPSLQPLKADAKFGSMFEALLAQYATPLARRTHSRRHETPPPRRRSLSEE
jgi:hypothetical protein